MDKITKIKVEVRGKENRKKYRKLNETKSVFQIKLIKINKPLAKLIIKKEETNYQYQD